MKDNDQRYMYTEDKKVQGFDRQEKIIKTHPGVDKKLKRRG